MALVAAVVPLPVNGGGRRGAHGRAQETGSVGGGVGRRAEGHVALDVDIASRATILESIDALGVHGLVDGVDRAGFGDADAEGHGGLVAAYGEGQVLGRGSDGARPCEGLVVHSSVGYRGIRPGQGCAAAAFDGEGRLP